MCVGNNAGCCYGKILLYNKRSGDNQRVIHRQRSSNDQLYSDKPTSGREGERQPATTDYTGSKGQQTVILVERIAAEVRSIVCASLRSFALGVTPPSSAKSLARLPAFRHSSLQSMCCARRPMPCAHFPVDFRFFHFATPKVQLKV
jgi:hypothetical protein